MNEEPLDYWASVLAAQPPPILARSLAILRAARQDEDSVDARSLGQALSGDPLLVVRVFAQLVARRHGHAADAEVATLERAVVLLGVSPFLRLFDEAAVVEEILAEDRMALSGVRRVHRRARRAARFARAMAVWRNDVNAEEIVLAAELHGFAEMLVWCVAPSRAREATHLQRKRPGLRSAVAQRAVFGTSYQELARELARRWRLPALITDMLDGRHDGNPRVRNAVLAVRLARHSTRSWRDRALPDDYREIGALLSASPHSVWRSFAEHESASDTAGTVERE